MRGLAAVGVLLCASCHASTPETHDGSADVALDAGEGPAADDHVDLGMDVPAFCEGLAAVTLSAPTVISGATSPGGSAMIQLTMADADPNGYISYVGVVLATTTAGVTIPFPDLGPPGALISHAAEKPIVFTARFDATIPPGTNAAFTARVYGWGHPAPDCADAFVLSFSLPVQ